MNLTFEGKPRSRPDTPYVGRSLLREWQDDDPNGRSSDAGVTNPSTDSRPISSQTSDGRRRLTKFERMQTASQGQKDRAGEMAGVPVRNQGNADNSKPEDVKKPAEHPPLARSSEDEGTQDEENDQDFEEAEDQDEEEEEEDGEDAEEEEEEDAVADGEKGASQQTGVVPAANARDEHTLRQAEQTGRLACIIFHSKANPKATRCFKNLADGTFEVPEKDMYGMSASAVVNKFGPTGGRESRIGIAIKIWVEGKAEMTEDGMGLDPGLFETMDDFTVHYGARLRAIEEKFSESEPAEKPRPKLQEVQMKRPQKKTPRLSVPPTKKQKKDGLQKKDVKQAARPASPPRSRNRVSGNTAKPLEKVTQARQPDQDTGELEASKNLLDLGGAVLHEANFMRLDPELQRDALRGAQFSKMMSDWLNVGRK